jgi:hypothetical protein
MEDNYTRCLLHFDGAPDAYGYPDFTDEYAGDWYHTYGCTFESVSSNDADFGLRAVKCNTFTDLSNVCYMAKLVTEARHDVSNGDFTIDFRNKPGSSQGTLFRMDNGLTNSFEQSISLCSAVAENGYALYLRVVHPFITSGNHTITSVSSDAWRHLEICRNGLNYLVFFDGLKTSMGFTASGAHTWQFTNIYIAHSYSANSSAHNHCYDEFRLSVGIARHTTSFTPPTENYVTEGNTLNSSVLINPQMSTLLTNIAMVLSLNASINIAPHFQGNLFTPARNVNSSIYINPRFSGIAWNRKSPHYLNSSILISPLFTGTLDEPWPMTGGVTIPLLEIDSWGYESCLGTASINLPVETIQAEGLDSCIGIGNVRLKLRISANGEVSGVGTANINIPILRLSATGLDSVIGTASLIIPKLKLNISVAVNCFGTADLTIPKMWLSSTFLPGITGIGDLKLPVFNIYGIAVESIEGIANLIIPSLFISAETDIAGTLTLAMNIVNEALTLYSNYIFNSMCNFNGKNIGAKAGGLYDLSGDTDDNELIEWNFRPGLLDLESTQINKLKEAWFGYKGDDDFKVKIILPNGEEYEYDLTLYSQSEYRSRVKFGKGIRTRYAYLDVSSYSGNKIDLDVIKLHFRQGTKR